MQSFVILVALSLAGQCSGGSCPSPNMGYRMAPQGFAPQSPVFSPVRHGSPSALSGLGSTPVRSFEPVRGRVEGQDFYVVRKHKVKYDGMSIVVEGFFRADTGKVNWNPESPANARSIAEAKVARAARVEKPTEPDRVPSAEPGPPFEPEPAPTPVAAPDAEPAPAAAAAPEIQNFGIVAYKMAHGYKAPSAEAKRFVAEAQSPVESLGRLHVTVIGTDEARAAVIRDLDTHHALAELKPLLMVQGYRPGDWAVDPALGFQAGKPAIIVQTAKGPGDPKGGRVVFRVADYSMGPEKLAEAIRKADPHYKPGSDPTPNSPGTSGCPLGFTRSHWGLIIIALLAVALTLLLPKKGA